MTSGSIAGVPVDISRTGYTGDLGYEIWIPWDRAVEVWDALMTGGRPFDIRPAGMLALDVARVEAGLLLIDVDFHSSKKALIDGADLLALRDGPRQARAARRRPLRRAPGARRRSTGWLEPSDRRPRNRLAVDRAAVRRARHGAADSCRGVARRGARLQGRRSGRPGDDDDVVAGPEEADRAGDDRRAALRRGHAARFRDHDRSGPPPRPGKSRQDAVLQSQAENSTASDVRRSLASSLRTSNRVSAIPPS